MECALTGVTVQQGRFRLARFNDVWLSGVRLTATELTETTWSDAMLGGCVAAGVTMDAPRCAGSRSATASSTG